VRDGAVVIDVGMNRVSDRARAEHLFSAGSPKRAAFEKNGSALTGDVDFERVQSKASAITPVPAVSDC
jgi:5,10-methylene-tetrahydrofolate dehydrogenase/methenyl tetrahydrofolate cyclohydrolase